MPGSFSGNTSVEWFVDVDNPRGTPVSKNDPKPGKPKRHHQSGVDDFGDGAYEFVVFEVSTKIGRHFWRNPGVPLDAEDWDRLPGRFAATPPSG